MLRKKLILLFLFLLLVSEKSSVLALDYYVRPSGNDNNTGTSQTSAWQTIEKVNSFNFSSGDRILFEGGQAFPGSLNLDQNDKGTGSNPIQLSSFGTNKAIINSGSSTGLYAYNTAGLKISNLIFSGNGLSLNNEDGIFFYNDLAGNIKLDGIQIDNVEISGYGNAGIEIGSWNGTSGFQNVTISNSVLHDNRMAGIYTFGQNLYSHKNIKVSHCQTYNIPGDAGSSTNSGNGIVLSSVDGGIIERSVSHDNGSAGFGSVGIWAYDSNNITIQYNESYRQKTAKTTDGGGFDLDGGITNSVLQFNYSHDNDGAGYLLCEYSGAPTWSNNIVRYNISQNDGRKNSYSGIQFWNGGAGVSNAEVYNNTIYISPSVTGSPRGIYFMNGTSNIHLRNNLIVTTGGLKLIEVTSGQTNLLLQGNNYFSSGSNFNMTWSGTAYSSLDSFRNSTGQEKLNANPVGFSIDPGLVNPGGGGIINDSDNLSSLSAYRLESSSPMIDAGLNLPQLFGLNVGANDFYSVSTPQGNSYDIGASELIISASPTPACRADINKDKTVNLADIVAILGKWGQTGSLAEDLNSDGVVNLGDLQNILSFWGQSCS